MFLVRPDSLICALLATGLLACGPDSNGGDGETTATIGEDSATGGTDTDTGGGSTSVGSEIEGLEVHSSSHSYNCISGCESLYSIDTLSITLTAEADMDITIAWHDWNITDSELALAPTAFDTDEVHLDAGVRTTIYLRHTSNDFCSQPNDWHEPMRALITIDDVPLELSGTSVGGMGYDDGC